jgi:UDPglucose 6-dehydrogenase
MVNNAMAQNTDLADAPIAIVGLGHVGLPTALGLAELGKRVTGADGDAAKVARIRAERPPFYEPGLSDLLSKHLRSGRFQPTEDVGAGVRSGSIIFICVGTPQKASGQADLSQVESVTRVVARNRNGYKLIVEKSTVHAITAQWLKSTIVRYRLATARETPGSSSDEPRSSAAASFEVTSNSEFLREGGALEDFLHCTIRRPC